MPQIEQLINKIESFPTLPTIYTSLLEVTSNPRSTVQDVANILMQDQASVVKLLKVINSPIYGLSVKITSISQAIMLLGFAEVKNAILALSVVDMFSGVDKDLAMSMVEMWKHSIAVGVISRILGVNLKLGDVENFFVAGLIHDIGKLFYLTTFKENYIQVVNRVKENRADLSDYERKVFGASHDEAGEMLAKKWDLPDNLKNAIKYHHEYPTGEKIDPMLACVHLANILAKAMNLGESFESIINQPSFEIWNALNFRNGALTDLTDSIKETFIQSSSILILNA